jgi:ABC-type transport system substrate-binding protein
MTYCNRSASNLLQRAQITPNNVQRRNLLHQAERIMATDVPSIPMYVRPGFLINRRTVSGLQINPTQQGSTWNSELWRVAQ